MAIQSNDVYRSRALMLLTYHRCQFCAGILNQDRGHELVPAAVMVLQLVIDFCLRCISHKIRIPAFLPLNCAHATI